MASTSPLRGLSTVSLFAEDHAAARQWYTELFGNILGLMYNPHYLEVLASLRAAHGPNGEA